MVYSKQKALQTVKDLLEEENSDAILMEEKTIELELGWIIFYESKQYLQTRNPKVAFVGNTPYFFNKFTGKITTFGSYLSLENMIAEFYEQCPYWGIKVAERGPPLIKILRTIFSDKNILELKKIIGKIPNLVLMGSKTYIQSVKHQFFDQEMVVEVVFLPPGSEGDFDLVMIKENIENSQP